MANNLAKELCGGNVRREFNTSLLLAYQVTGVRPSLAAQELSVDAWKSICAFCMGSACWYCTVQHALPVEAGEGWLQSSLAPVHSLSIPLHSSP